MSIWDGANALVTGAGSGIGLALSESMVARGANVWLTDINEADVEAAAQRLGPTAHAAVLDVRDAVAVRESVERIAKDQARLDLLFNNAGIGGGGEAHTLSVEHYDRIIDINVRGVTNGVAAAYPLMVEQRRGHIINTASAAGLLPAPLLTPYTMTKHAIVGLSKALRFEAANFGVNVSALCPTAVETPILDGKGPDDLPKVWVPNLRSYLERIGGPPMPVSEFATYALGEIERNRDVIVAPASARAAALLYRWVPWLVESRINRALTAELQNRT